MKILVTGFDPFGGDPINPAFEAVRKIPKSIAGADIEILEIPTVFHKSIRTVTDVLDRGSFDAVLLVGQAGGALHPYPRTGRYQSGRRPHQGQRGKSAYRRTDSSRRPRSLLQHPAHQGHGAEYPQQGNSRQGFQHCGNLCLQPPDVRSAPPHRQQEPFHPGRLHSRPLPSGAGTGAGQHSRHGSRGYRQGAGSGGGSHGAAPYGYQRHRRSGILETSLPKNSFAFPVIQTHAAKNIFFRGKPELFPPEIFSP